jgi:hypothetical protein
VTLKARRLAAKLEIVADNGGERMHNSIGEPTGID